MIANIIYYNGQTGLYVPTFLQFYEQAMSIEKLLQSVSNFVCSKSRIFLSVGMMC